MRLKLALDITAEAGAVPFCGERRTARDGSVTMTETFLDFGDSVYMNVVESAHLWSTITGDGTTVERYIGMCESGELEREGVVLRMGKDGSWLTDMDSLLAFLDRSITAQHERIKEALEERRMELEGL